MTRNRKKILKVLKEATEAHPEWRIGWIIGACLPSGKSISGITDFDLANALTIWVTKWPKK